MEGPPHAVPLKSMHTHAHLPSNTRACVHTTPTEGPAHHTGTHSHTHVNTHTTHMPLTNTQAHKHTHTGWHAPTLHPIQDADIQAHRHTHPHRPACTHTSLHLTRIHMSMPTQVGMHPRSIPSNTQAHSRKEVAQKSDAKRGVWLWLRGLVEADFEPGALWGGQAVDAYTPKCYVQMDMAQHRSQVDSRG